MTEIQINYFFNDEKDKRITIGNMFINGQRVHRLSETPIGDIDEGEIMFLEDLEELNELTDKKRKVILEEVESLEVDYTDEADLMYARGGHGCESFDEFIDKMNFPEDYE